MKNLLNSLLTAKQYLSWSLRWVSFSSSHLVNKQLLFMNPEEMLCQTGRQTWIGLSSVLRPLQHSIGYYGRQFLQVKRPDQQYQSTEGESCKGKQHKKHKENRKYTHTKKYTNNRYTNKHSKSPSLHKYGVTRRQLPQTAGSLGLNGGGTAAAVPQADRKECQRHNGMHSVMHRRLSHSVIDRTVCMMNYECKLVQQKLSLVKV